MPQKDDAPRLKVDDAVFNFRNFSGRNSRFASADVRRNFGVVLDPELAAQLAADGWAVKYPKPGDELRADGEEKAPYLVVHLGYKIRAPRVVMELSGGRIELGEDQVEVLDWADIAQCRFICTLRTWHMDETGASGNKAWLKTMVVHIEEDELEVEYGLNTLVPGVVPDGSEDDGEMVNG